MVLLRAGLVRLLGGEGITTVGEAGDGPALLLKVAAERPDAALVDIRMPPTCTDEGLRAALAIREQPPATAVLPLSSYLDGRYASQLLESAPSAGGYLLKERIVTLRCWWTRSGGSRPVSACWTRPWSHSC